MKQVLENIKRIRKSKKLSLSDIAEHLNMTTPNYHRIEKGESPLSLDRLYELAQFLGVSVVELLGETALQVPNGEAQKIAETQKEKLNALATETKLNNLRVEKVANIIEQSLGYPAQENQCEEAKSAMFFAMYILKTTVNNGYPASEYYFEQDVEKLKIDFARAFNQELEAINKAKYDYKLK